MRAVAATSCSRSFEVANSFTGRVFGLYAVEGTVTFAELRYSGTDVLPG